MALTSIVFTHDIDRSYLLKLDKSKKLRQSKTQSHFEPLEDIPEKPDLIRKKRSYSTAEFYKEHSVAPHPPPVDTVTDVEGLRQHIEYVHNKQNQQQIRLKNNPGHFSPIPPRKSLEPRSPRALAIRNIQKANEESTQNKISNGTQTTKKSHIHRKKQVNNQILVFD